MGKKGTKRKTRWRVLPIGEDGGSGSNEEEGECENGSGSSAGTYARATQQQRAAFKRPSHRDRGGNPSTGGYYNKQHYHHNSRSYNHHDTHQPLVTTEKQIFNEEEYTKITTPRQDVLFKKGYLGRKRPTVTTTESSDQTTTADVVNGNALHYHPSAGQNEDCLDNDPNEMLEDQPQFIYTNGFVDQSGIYYINGSGYEIFDPYSGQVTVVVGPHYGPNGGPPVLAAVPCQPVPLQPLEWFNPPGFLPYVTAPCHNGLARDRRKRYSTDSQNCSPQSSESTGPPGSPQESDEVPLNGGAEGPMYHPHHPPPPPYVYPGYMFGAPMYNMNGVTVQSTPNAAPSSDVGGKRRKKKRRRRRRRNGVEDGSEESSSEDKEHEEEPMSVTSQESSHESDSKLSTTGEKPRPPVIPTAGVIVAPVDEPLVAYAAETCVTKSNAHTQTAVDEKEEAVEFHQQPSLASLGDNNHQEAATERINFAAKVRVVPLQQQEAKHKQPLVNGYHCVNEPVNGVVSNQPVLNGGSVSRKEYSSKDVVVNGDRLVNGYEGKSKIVEKKEKKGKKVNGLTNGVANKPREVFEKPLDDSDDFVFQDDSFLYTQEFINGNVKVELEEENEWITVKGHKGSQGKRSDSGRFTEEKKFPSELTNGHAKSNRDYKVNGVNGKDKVQYKNNGDRLNKTDKSYHNGKVEERCTYAKAKQCESGYKEKTQFNGRAKVVNGTRMDGNEKEDSPSSGKEVNDGEEVVMKRASVEKSGSQSESQKDVPKMPTQDVEDFTPTKPSRKERKAQKNGSPPKTPEVTLTATAKPFVMPMVSLRPETFVKQGGAATSSKPDNLSGEDSLMAALTFSLKDTKSLPETAKTTSSPVKEEVPNKEAKKTSEVNKKGNSNSEKKRKSPPSPEAAKVRSLKDLTMKSIEKEQIVASVSHNVASEMPSSVIKSLKESSKEFLETESRQCEIPKTEKRAEAVDKPINVMDPEQVRTDRDVAKQGGRTIEAELEFGATPPVPPPRRKKWRPANKRLPSDRASTPGQAGESTDESSSSSSQESEESVIECLSSGFNSPKVKISSGFSSSSDEDIIYKGNLDEQDPKALKRISESQEDSTSLNGKALKQNNSSKKIVLETKVTPNTPVSKEASRAPLPQVSVQSTTKFKDTNERYSGISKSEEHKQNVQKMAQEIVDSVIEEAMKESVRLKYQKDNDPVKLGITDAVTRWLRSQSPDVLSLPRNEDSDSDISTAEDLEADAEENPLNGSKNLKSNPLPAPSVEENIGNQLRDLVGDDGMGRRVANTTSEKKDLKDTRNIDTPDLEDDAISNESVSCGEWDLWDCQHSFVQKYDEMLHKSHRNTKNTNEKNIISDTITPHLPPPCVNSSSPLVLEYLSLTPELVKYDPLANDTFSPIESTLLSEVLEPHQGHDRCSNMCDAAQSVAKYYILGPRPGKTLSPIEDLECSDSEGSSLTENNDDPNKYGVSLAEELSRLEQPLPKSWAVEPVRIEKAVRGAKRCGACQCSGQDAGSAAVDSGVESGEEIPVTRKRESMSVFKRKLVGRLKGEGAPFPCGGICCILQ